MIRKNRDPLFWLFSKRQCISRFILTFSVAFLSSLTTRCEHSQKHAAPRQPQAVFGQANRSLTADEISQSQNDYSKLGQAPPPTTSSEVPPVVPTSIPTIGSPIASPVVPRPSDNSSTGLKLWDSSSVEFENCKLSAQRFPSLLSEDLVECTDNYLLFESKKLSGSVSKKAKIGSFNIIRIGQSQSRFKRNDFVAKIMNQWDLVNVLEIMNMSKEHIEFNAKIDAVAAGLNPKHRSAIENSYELPRYLLILKELRLLDKSWSLIMSPRATGETVASYEYVGFFYKNGKVKNLKTSFCNNQRGCLTPVDQENYKNLISRSPFIAHFEIGALKFNAVGAHLRFRVPAEDCAKLGTPGKTPKKPCVSYSKNEKEIVQSLQEVTGRTTINKEDARYLELAIAYKELKKSKDEIFLMGDFNLEFKDNTKKLWNFALGHENVYVSEKTSISTLYGLSKMYDHFIFNPGPNLSKCATDSAKAFNFVLDPMNPQTDIDVLKDLESFLRARSDTEKMLTDFENKLKADTIINYCDESQCFYIPRYDTVQTTKLLCIYEKNVLGVHNKICKEDGSATDSDTDAPVSTKPPLYKVYHEIISDHIPIEIECSTDS